MSAVVFVGEEKPIKGLVSKSTYRVYPSPEIKEQIFKDLWRDLPSSFIKDDYIINMEIKVTLSKYEQKPPQQGNFWYEKKINDT